MSAPPAPPSGGELLRWQLDVTGQLLDYHLARLAPEDFLWEPAATCWTLRRDASGAWVPDWEVPEPEPIPVPTIAWLSWHLGWWWSVACDHLRGRTPRGREEVVWPGPERAVAWLRDIAADWSAALDGLSDADFERPAAFPWPADAGYTVAHLVAWAGAELMKNVAEIGQLRLLKGSTDPDATGLPDLTG